jgi:hypothetical protein
MLIKPIQINVSVVRPMIQNEVSLDQNCHNNPPLRGHYHGLPFFLKDSGKCQCPEPRRSTRFRSACALQPGQGSYLDQLEQGSRRTQNSEARLKQLGYRKHNGVVRLSANSAISPPGTTYWTGPKGEAVRIMPDGSVKPQWGDPVGSLRTGPLSAASGPNGLG